MQPQQPPQNTYLQNTNPSPYPPQPQAYQSAQPQPGAYGAAAPQGAYAAPQPQQTAAPNAWQTASQPRPMQPAGSPAPAQNPYQTAQQPQLDTTSGVLADDMKKMSRNALFYGIGSLIVFVVGFFLGFAALIGAGLGAIAIRNGKLSGNNVAFGLGITGVVINLVFYLLAVFLH